MAELTYEEQMQVLAEEVKRNARENPDVEVEEYVRQHRKVVSRQRQNQVHMDSE